MSEERKGGSTTTIAVAVAVPIVAVGAIAIVVVLVVRKRTNNRRSQNNFTELQSISKQNPVKKDENYVSISNSARYQLEISFRFHYLHPFPLLLSLFNFRGTV